MLQNVNVIKIKKMTVKSITYENNVNLKKNVLVHYGNGELYVIVMKMSLFIGYRLKFIYSFILFF